MSSWYKSINKQPDPRCTRIRNTWNASGTVNGTKWRYEKDASASNGAVFCWGADNFNSTHMSGMVLFARVTTSVQLVLDTLSIENATTIAKNGEWIAARVADGNTGNHTLYVSNGPFVLQEVGVYTPDDWEHLYALWQAGKISIPWCAGPPNAAAGVNGPWQL